MEQERRNTILVLHRAGHKPGEIYKSLLDAWSNDVEQDIAGQALKYSRIAKTWKP